MSLVGFCSSSSLARAAGAVVFAALAAAGMSVSASAQQTSEIVISIDSLRAIDKPDAFSKADFFARVTIAGETFNTKIARQADWPKPGWQVSKRVPRGRHDVRIELFDKDLTKDDPIDINPRKDQPKRALDLTVSTPSCSISGLSGASCNRSIKRAGDEKKSAEIVFTVSVKR
jgi:hypothetical protein